MSSTDWGSISEYRLKSPKLYPLMFADRTARSTPFEVWGKPVCRSWNLRHFLNSFMNQRGRDGKRLHIDTTIGSTEVNRSNCGRSQWRRLWSNTLSVLTRLQKRWDWVTSHVKVRMGERGEGRDDGHVLYCPRKQVPGGHHSTKGADTTTWNDFESYKGTTPLPVPPYLITQPSLKGRRIRVITSIIHFGINDEIKTV